MRTLAIVGVVIGLALSSPAQAQAQVPSIASSFELNDGDPNPCMEFACFTTSAFDGNTLVAVGAEFPNIFVWVRDSAGVWSQQAVFGHPDPNAPPFNQYLGSLIALDGDDLVLSGGETGGVLVFHRSGTTWSYVQTLPTADFLDLEDGHLVSSEGGNFIAYAKGAGGLFRKRATLKLPRFVEGYLSGPVELDHDTAVIAGGDDADGAVFIFQRVLGVWLFVQKLAAPPAAAGGGFGAAVAIDRDRIAVGAPAVAGLDATRPGVVQTYARRGLRWRPTQLLSNPLPVESDGYARAFGGVLDLEGRRLVVSSARPYYPYAPPVTANYAYELTASGWDLSAALEAGPARVVEVSGSSVLIDVSLLRLGTAPNIFALP